MSSSRALAHLSSDPVMKKLIETHGELKWKEEDVDLFAHIIESIISQQLSVKASDTIYKRFIALLPKNKLTPENILRVSDEAIRGAGISFAKIAYIKGVAQAVIDKQIFLEKLHELPDEEVLIQLIKLKGIGTWTAEMLLMFSLKRPDVFSMGDVGLRNAIAKLYNVERDDLKKIEKIANKWKPYRTTAARYLWRSLDNEPTPAV